MNPRITSIENLIASDPGGRNVFGLVTTDQLRLAAQSLRLARRVGIVSGFFILEAGAGETDGPPGAKVLGLALTALGIKVDYLTDDRNAPLFRALGLDPIVAVEDYLDRAQPTHLVSIERVGRGADGRYRNMHGQDITDVSAPLDELFIDADRRGLTTIGVGDGGNEIGMGKVFIETTRQIEHGELIATTVATDFCVAAGLSNWGAYGLAGALSVLAQRDLLPSAKELADDMEALVRDGGAVDGVTHRREPTTDSVPLSGSLRMLESIRRHLGRPLFEGGRTRAVGILGYGETGRAAAALLSRYGHRVFVSDQGRVTVESGTKFAGVEAGGHTLEFFKPCDLIVVSPGVRGDSDILNEIHRAGIPVISEMELAFRLGFSDDASSVASLVAITGTVGKRTTVELLASLFSSTGRSLAIGGNRGLPLSALLADSKSNDPIALAVSSFQLESVVHFRPGISVILNISAQHLDRHGSIAEYVRIKSRVFMNQGPADVLILPYDDELLRPLARKHHGRTLFMSTRQPVDRGAWIAEGKLKINVSGTVELMGDMKEDFPENMLACVLIARLCGFGPEEVVAALHQISSPGAAH